jgi:hypothetical protein
LHVFGLLAIFIAIAVAFGGLQPPPAAGADAPIEAFSAERAMVHVRELVKKPHPVGSAGHAAVRDMLVARLRELGLSPEVQKTFTTAQFFGRISGAIVENVVARVPGRGGDRRALLFAAHYDAVPQSPGAGDDGAGTAALLETARAIVQGPPLDRDVVFLFTDGEELGLLGANAFVSEHPAAKDIIAAFNFDARGSRGSVAMFDTSSQSGGLIRALAHVPYIQASSFVSTLARMLPNDTDATIFKKAGIPTMSFAFADGVENYHRASDTAENLSPRSVQQMGDTALALARYLGRGALPTLEEDDRAYFTIIGRVVIHPGYGEVLVFAFVSLLLIGVAAAAVRRQLRGTTERPGRAILLGVAVALATFLVAGLVALGIGAAIHRSVSLDALLVRSKAIGLAAVAASLLVSVSLARLGARRFGANAIAIGALCSNAGIAILLAIFVVGASLPFVATAVFSVLCAGVLLSREGAPVRAIAVYLVTMAVIFFWLPTLYSIAVAAAANAAVPIGVLAVVPCLLIAPLVASASRRGLVIFTGATLGVIAIAFFWLVLPLGDAVPERSTLVYGVDADRKQGFIFSSEPRPWMSPLVDREHAGRRTIPELTLSDTEYWVSPAEVAGFSGVTVDKSERRRTADGFEISVALKPPVEARCIAIWDETHRITDVASVNGKAVRRLIRFSPEKDAALARRLKPGSLRSAFYFQFCGMSGDPIELVLHTNEEAEVPVRLVEVRDGLPPAPGGADLRRPAGEIATEDSDRTIIGKTVRL